MHCDVFAIQTIKQTNEQAVGAGHKLEESDWSVVGKCCHSLAIVARALFGDS